MRQTRSKKHRVRWILKFSDPCPLWDDAARVSTQRPEPWARRGSAWPAWAGLCPPVEGRPAGRAAIATMLPQLEAPRQPLGLRVARASHLERASAFCRSARRPRVSRQQRRISGWPAVGDTPLVTGGPVHTLLSNGHMEVRRREKKKKKRRSSEVLPRCRFSDGGK